MAGAKNAYMLAPDPRWGARIAGPEARHIANFDKWRDDTVRLHKEILLAGVLLLGASGVMALGRLSLGFEILFLPAFVGLLLVGGGLWIPWRLSFAFHRIWGVHEAGFVGPSYTKGGWEPLVPWLDVELLRLRRMKTSDPKTKADGEQFLIRAVDRHRMHHRIWQSELTKTWGFTEPESKAFGEGFMAAARRHVPPEKVVVEEGLSEDGT